MVLNLLWNFDLWLPVEIAIGMFAVLSVFSFLGGALYERRHELNLDTWVSPERTAALEANKTSASTTSIVLEAYGLMRASSHIKCWQMLEDWLKIPRQRPRGLRLAVRAHRQAGTIRATSPASPKTMSRAF